MDWENIREKYPKAMAILRDTKHYDLAEPRRLYDFFDSEGIYVWITPPFGTDIGLDVFDGEIRIMYNDYINKRVNVCGTKTRTEAEDQAFFKAFEILEEKLK